jgi:protein involved in polysaccharide export with SLBB domain
MSDLSQNRSCRIRVIFTLVLGFALIASAVGQSRVVSDHSTALDQADSRAEREAAQVVSLSPEKIISLLREEDGLMLEVKKLLVRKAFEQGRILDPEDLTDEALFQLVRDDQKIRVLITQEIEDRAYVRAKPTREELARMNASGLGQPPEDQMASLDSKMLNGQMQAGQSQEDVYWSTHDNQSQPGAPQLPLTQPPTQSAPGTPSQPNSQTPSVDDLRRQLLLTQMQKPQNAAGMQSQQAALMAKISPDQLPALLSASGMQSSSGASAGARGIGSSSGAMGGSNFSSTMLGSAGLGDLLENQNDEFEPKQQAKLEKPQTQTSKGELRLPQQPMLHHRPNPYADVPSLYDLYTQYSRRSPVLQRFGEEVFTTGTGNAEQLPMDLPAGPDYVVGPGDGLNIDLWGAVSQRLRRVVDREGRVMLPEAGNIQVAGRNLGEVQHLVQSVLRTQFRDVEADVSLGRVRTVRVYVVGDVQRPGAYDISSLSTPLNALYAAGGPTTQGSLRTLKHYRGKDIVQEVDVYDLLLHGIRSDVQRLQPGDTILVPPLGPAITIEGMVQRPAKYELRSEKTLAEALELAGGVLPSGTLRHVDVERLEAHESRTMLALDVPENNNQEDVNKALQEFKIQDGDTVKISPIVSFADKAVFLDGHVFRPGKYAYREGMKVADLIRSYKDLLPEPYDRHAEIIRLNAPDYSPVVMAFNLGDAMAGKSPDLVLKPFDTVRVFGRYDFEDPPSITVTGEVRDPGDHVTNGTTNLRDAIYLAGGATPGALLSDAQVFRHTEDGSMKVISVNLAKALSGSEHDNILLQPKDRLFVQRNLSKADPPTVVIAGQVVQPGKYPLGRAMNASDLVRLAGGFKRSAFTDSADLTRYTVAEGKKIEAEHVTIPIAKALSGDADTDMRLRDGDVLTIRELTGWRDVGATIEVQGEVVHPGTYGIRNGERLSSIIERAGGFREDAYPYGAVFQRAEVKELEAKTRSDVINQLQTQGAALKLIPEAEPEQKIAKEAALIQWQDALQKLQNTPPAGRQVIHISANMKHWVNSPADIQVRAKDVLYIPKRPNSVMVSGEVYNPTAVTYKPGRSAGWYLQQAGGPTNVANKKAIFVIRADGSVVGGRGGLFSGGAEGADMRPGDMVMVPEKGFTANTRWRTTLQAAQLAYAVGIAIQVGRSFR